ncbi:MFS allantoate transporter [Delitschia confertaspora ATCC 74209]|uniref:MFS allantoate transporter n=1 Tax=Delitschia confertaspora ATCC 74209 TaxID=1513339 RepID=A0A9P4MU51_9PLEO|nr:MFS allantoate transporter [Delitschia confertaspora ATCC 74209]
MRLFQRANGVEDIQQTRLQSSPDNKDKEQSANHLKVSSLPPSKWKVSRQDGDTAIAVFQTSREAYEPHDPAEEKRLIRKIDFIIIPYLAVCYAFFYIDKTTLSYAAIFGIREDLHLKGTDYSWLSSMFYFGFLVWAFPTNFLLQKLPIGKYLGFNIFLWGILLIAQAGATNFATLAVLRALSGAAEACSDPSFMLITCMWYTRREQPVRIGLWYTANGFGIALGGLLGYAIGHIRGSLPSWKYEFIIIGCLCSAWGIILFLFLPDSPVTAPMLNKRERRIAVERLRENQTGIENKHLKMYQVIEAIKDLKTWLFFLIATVHNSPNGGISNFGTIIIKGFGFSTLATTLMQVPYGVLIALFILSCVYLNDYFCNRLKRNTRCWFILFYLTPNIAGAFGLRYVPLDQHVVRLWCYYLTGPYNAAFVLVLSLAIGNTAGHTKKVVTNAFLFLGYCAGNIAGPFFFKAEQSPTYPLGMWSMIFCHLAEVVLVIAFALILSRENKRRDRMREGGQAQLDIDETAFGDLTDRENPNFRYVY